MTADLFAQASSMTPTAPSLMQRRWHAFRANHRAYWAFWIFAVLLLLTLFAELLANDQPILVWYDGGAYWPVFHTYPETTFGGTFETAVDFTDPTVRELIAAKGFMIEPLVPYDHRTVAWNMTVPAPSAPDAQHWLGTDDQARDVLARLIYGFRISVLFGFAMTILSSVIGVAVGAIQGYFGGWVDLLGQRFIEIWSGMPVFFLLIILASLVEPNFWWLLGVTVIFGWMSLVGLVRAEFLRARNFDYVRAAKALGAGNLVIMWRHVLPNALVATLSMLPFMLAGSVTLLTSLDFLGVGLPPGSASLGELLSQGRSNLQAPWLGITGFATISIMLTLLIFIGEGVRDAFDPRKTPGANTRRDKRARPQRRSPATRVAPPKKASR